MFQRIVLALAILILVVACGEPAEPAPAAVQVTRVEPQLAENAFITVALEEVEVMASTGDTSTTTGALRVFMFVADATGNVGGLFCPAGAAMPVNVGDTARPCSFALGIQEGVLGESLYLLVLGMGETEASPLAALGHEASVGLLAAGLGEAVGASAGTAEVTLESVLARGAPELQQAMANENVIGARGAWLQRENDWNVDQPLVLTTDNGRMRMALKVSRATSASRQPIVQLPVQPATEVVAVPTSTIAAVVEQPVEAAPASSSTPLASATWTPMPTPVPVAAATSTPVPVVCPGALPTRLTVGGSARVVNYQVNVRSGPGTDFAVANRLRPGRVVEILQPPQCDEGQLWYHVLSEELRDADGRPFQIQGWVVEESDGTYYLEPVP